MNLRNLEITYDENTVCLMFYFNRFEKRNKKIIATSAMVV